MVVLFWVVFRADNFATAVKVWKGAFSIHTGISQPYSWSIFAIICLVLGTLTAYYRSKKMDLKDKKGFLNITGYYPVLDLSKFWSQVVFFTFCGLTIILGYFGNTAFIYGAF